MRTQLMARLVVLPERRDWLAMSFGKNWARHLMNHDRVGMVPLARNQRSGLKVKHWSQDCKYLMKAEYESGGWRACCMMMWLPSKVGSDLWESSQKENAWESHWTEEWREIFEKSWRAKWSGKQILESHNRPWNPIRSWEMNSKSSWLEGNLRSWQMSLRSSKDEGFLQRMGTLCRFLAPLSVRDMRALWWFFRTSGEKKFHLVYETG